MQNFLKTLRYLVFAIFIICSAIITSVSVWNFSISKAKSNELQVDNYLTFVGASGLVFVFVVIILELAHKHPITSRVWFECTWIGIYWLLELAGAATLSAVGPPAMCTNNKGQRLVSESCSSTQILLATCWICTLTLMAYLMLLIITSLIQQKDHKPIWQCEVHHFPWADTHRILSSAPSTPIRGGFGTQPSPLQPVIAAPKPRRVPPPELYAYRSGLPEEYKIEHYQPSATYVQPTLPEPAAITSRRQFSQQQNSFYPQYMRAYTASQSSHQQHPLPPVAPTSELPNRISTSPPPPLGNWPRADIMSQPVQPRSSKTKQPRPPPHPQSAGVVQSSNTRDNRRPPPLDLSTLTSFQ